MRVGAFHGVLVGAVFLVAGCVSTGTARSQLSYGSVKLYMVRGRTRQAEVTKLFGPPDLITKNAQGYQVWTYNRQTYEPPSVVNGSSAVPFQGNNVGNVTNGAGFDLVLTFDGNDVLEDYSMVTSKF